MERARADEFQPLSAAAVSNAISASLWTAGTNREQETRSLSDALSALGTGNASPIRERAARAENEVDGDGQFIGRCTDGMQWPGIGRARELADTWGTNYPVFGREAALGLLACASWPSTANSPLPNQLKPPVLVLSGQGDPAVGNSGLSTVTGVVTNAGSRFATLDWQGAGHPAAQSTCAQQAMRLYLSDAPCPVTEACARPDSGARPPRPKRGASPDHTLLRCTVPKCSFDSSSRAPGGQPNKSSTSFCGRSP